MVFCGGGPVSVAPAPMSSMASLALILDRFCFFSSGRYGPQLCPYFCKALRRNDWQEADRVAQATKGGEAHLAVRLP